MRSCRTLLLLLAVSAAMPASSEDLRARIDADYATNLAALFEHFHRNPELSFRETETARRIADELRKLGIAVTERVGGTGVVGILENGEGPRVLVRADMDGLPILEDSGLEYASTATQEDIDGVVKPVMHACGHDVHITSLIGTARQLVEARERWSGTVMFVAQPAEERIGGAKAMLEDGLYERFGVPDFALALHVAAGKPAGKIALEPGLIASSSDSVDITVRGVGAHGASPHKGRDPIYLASRIVVALQSLVSRELSPLEPGVVTVGSFHAGFKHNIIPDEARLQLTVRADSEETRETLLEGIERIARGIAVSAGLDEALFPTVEHGFESTPTTVNDEALVARLRPVFEGAFGEEGLYRDLRSGMGAEDFAYFTRTEEKVPGAYFVVGGTLEEEIEAEKEGGPPAPAHHSPFFRIEPEPAVTSGVEAMTIAVLELLPVQ